MAMSALGPLLRAKPEEDRDRARALIYRVEEIAELRGLGRTDRIASNHQFVAQALSTLANAKDVEHFSWWAEQALSDRRARHARVNSVWNAIADAAPAMGMAGTIIGLVGMFAQMSDPNSIGPAMALALMTTLHGMILANVIAGPIASRLTRLSELELDWQDALIRRMTAIAQREEAEPPARRSKNVREAA